MKRKVMLGATVQAPEKEPQAQKSEAGGRLAEQRGMVGKSGNLEKLRVYF